LAPETFHGYRPNGSLLDLYPPQIKRRFNLPSGFSARPPQEHVPFTQTGLFRFGVLFNFLDNNSGQELLAGFFNGRYICRLTAHRKAQSESKTADGGKVDSQASRLDQESLQWVRAVYLWLD
jgi:hypothetical protein